MATQVYNRNSIHRHITSPASSSSSSSPSTHHGDVKINSSSIDAVHDYSDYWKEYDDIESTKDVNEDDEESVKTPDEDEQEVDFLKEAGYGHIISKFEDGRDLSDDELELLVSTLTKSQAAAVKRRVDFVSTTYRRKHKHAAKTDVRDIFNQNQNESDLLKSPERLKRSESTPAGQHRPMRRRNSKGKETSLFKQKGGYDMTGMSNQVLDNTDNDLDTNYDIHCSFHKGEYALRKYMGSEDISTLSYQAQIDAEFQGINDYADIGDDSDADTIENENISPIEKTGQPPTQNMSTLEPDEQSAEAIATLSLNPKSTVTRTASDSVTNQLSQLQEIEDGEMIWQFKEAEEEIILDYKLGNKIGRKDDLPTFSLIEDTVGITRAADLSTADMAKIRALATIELTALFDKHNIMFTRRKYKRKTKEIGIFGVSIDCLVDHDQKYLPYATQVPIVFKQIVHHLEKTGLDTEGILRVPGSASRIKQIRRDIEEKFYQGQFVWNQMFPNDTAALMKQFLRELPIPLLTYDYLDAFGKVETIHDRKQQVQALNLLVLMLPESHRETLMVLVQFLRRVIDHCDLNKMGLNNVAMIMAPNLFMTSASKKNLGTKELGFAAGTSNIIRMLIKYQDILSTIPSFMVMQIRHQYELENHHRKTKDRVRMKFLGKKEKTDMYKKPSTSVESELQGVIRVQAPHLTKSGAAIHLDDKMTAGDVVAKFRRHRSNSNPVETKDSHSMYRTPSGKVSLISDNGMFAEDDTHLYEIGGNIGERCLNNNANMMAVTRVNPSAEWVIKSKSKG